MTAFDTNHNVPLGSVATLRLVAVLERGYDAFVAWRSARATAHELARLSDLQLADIGLHRGEIVNVAGQLAQRR